VKKEGFSDSVAFPGTELSVYLLQKLIAEKLQTKENDLTLLDVNTGIKIAPT
jgi:hypothetical protein